MNLRENCQRKVRGKEARIILHYAVPALLAVLTSFAAADDWPGWRGPQGNGYWNAPPLAENWPEKLPIVWDAKIGPAYSGISVATTPTGRRVFTMDRSGSRDRIVSLDAETGEQVWAYEYEAGYGELQYGKGPRCTPTVHKNRVYTFGTVGHLHCLNATTGEKLWEKDLVRDFKAKQPTWGFAASPVIFANTVIIHAGAEPDGCYISFNCETGEERWRVGADPAGYGTPILSKRGSQTVLIGWTPEHVVVISPQDGKLIEQIAYKVTMGVSIATPIFRESTILVSGYWEGAKAILLDNTGSQVIWEENRYLRGLMAQPLYRDGHVFLLDKQHGIVCCRLDTGKIVWTDKNRLTPRARDPQATLVWAGDTDRAVCLNERGELVLCRFSPSGYIEIARSKILGETWAHPAYVGSRVYARDDSRIVCVDLPIDIPHKN